MHLIDHGKNHLEKTFKRPIIQRIFRSFLSLTLPNPKIFHILSVIVNIARPLRCGIFAASASNPERPLVGGAYYGVMEMTGNLEEFVANVASGGTYNGFHGNGSLTGDGKANVNGWPTLPGGDGKFGLRGGAWNEPSWLGRTSDREHASWGNARDPGIGLRGVRSAP